MRTLNSQGNRFANQKIKFMRIFSNLQYLDVVLQVSCFVYNKRYILPMLLLIREEAKRLAKDKNAFKLKILPMHGSLPASEQVRIREKIG